MALSLTIPPQSGAAAHTVETDVQKTGLWLEHLPVLNAFDSLQQVHKALSDINRIPLKAKHRLALLELYRPTLSVITGEFKRQISTAGFPLGRESLTLAQQLRTTQSELASGYMAAVVDLVAGWQRSPTHPSLVLALHRAIRTLSETFVQSACYHADPPQGLWHDLHQLALYSIQCGLFERKAKDSTNRTLAKTSIAHAYKQALLMGCLDAFRQPLYVIINAFHYLDRWANGAKLVKAQEYRASRCLFYIDPRHDRPFMAAIDTDSLGKNIIQLNARKLEKQLHYHWLNLKSSVKPSLDGLDPKFFDEDAEFVLKSMAMAWSGRRKRRFSRKSDTDQAVCDICVGVAAVNHYVNGEQPFVYSRPMRSRDSTYTAGTFGQQKNARTTQTYIYGECIIEDQSAGGLQLSFPDSSALKLQVDSLCGIRQPGKQDWLIGVVCWMRYDDREVLHCGIRLLAPNAQPAMIKPVSIDDSDESPFVPCLVLPAAPPQTTPTLITPAGNYSVNENLQLDTGKELIRIRTNRQLENHRRFDWFDFAELEL